MGPLISRGGKPRPSYDRELVLEAAVYLFNRRGYDATSMAAIADYLGVTRAALYYHVPSKLELLRLALEDALLPLEAIFHAPGARDGTAGQRLEFVLRRAIAVQIDRQPSVTLLRHLRGNNDVECNALNRRCAFDEGIFTLTSLARKEGSLRADVDARSAARFLAGAVHTVSDGQDLMAKLPPLRLADTVLTILMDGLRDPTKERDGG